MDSAWIDLVVLVGGGGVSWVVFTGESAGGVLFCRQDLAASLWQQVGC